MVPHLDLLRHLLFWAAWAVLWFMFFLLLARGLPIGKLTGTVTVAQGILTGWLPGFLLLQGWMGPTAAPTG